jgi:hypothetical protein
MKTGVFRDKDDAPSDGKLKRVLGPAYSLFVELIELPRGYEREWKYYGKGYGWQYKISDSKKALFYVSPLQGSFMAVFGVREKERKALLASRLSEKIKAEIQSARKHPEGYAVRFMVSNITTFKAAKTTLNALIGIRSSPGIGG